MIQEIRGQGKDFLPVNGCQNQVDFRSSTYPFTRTSSNFNTLSKEHKNDLLSLHTQGSSKARLGFPSLGNEVIREDKEYGLSTLNRVQTLKIRIFPFCSNSSSWGPLTHRVGSKIHAAYLASTRRLGVSNSSSRSCEIYKILKISYARIGMLH